MLLVSSAVPSLLRGWLPQPALAPVSTRVAAWAASPTQLWGHAGHQSHAAGTWLCQGPAGVGMGWAGTVAGVLLWTWQLCQDTSCQPMRAVQRMMRREEGRQLTRATGAWLALGVLGLAGGCQAV